MPVSTVSFNSFFVLATFFSGEDRRNTDIHLLKIVESRCFLLIFNVLCCFGRSVRRFGRRQLVELALDYVVLDLFEEKYGFADPMSGSEQVGAAQFLPAEGPACNIPTIFFAEKGMNGSMAIERFAVICKAMFRIVLTVRDRF